MEELKNVIAALKKNQDAALMKAENLYQLKETPRERYHTGRADGLGEAIALLEALDAK